ncbi:MAG: LytTR family DNA-binding domain-containing protein [Oscillospiraceae bacterium]|nr:LytTR family DNA-binding domain-containing protein [Oscillospiraceae bacterium]
MRIAICDDIRTQAEELAQLVVQYYGENAKVQTYECGETLISAITKDSMPQFDLIFLDILMPEHNGIDVAKHIRLYDEDVTIIFVTSTPDYALDGYTVDAAAYITKPAEMEQLKDVLDKFERRRVKIADERIVVNADGSVVSIPFAEIRSIEKFGRKTVITRIGQPTIQTNQPINEIVQQFGGYTQFAIVSQSNYVNLFNALEVDKKGRFIRMCDGTEIGFARERTNALLDRFFMEYGGDK